MPTSLPPLRASARTALFVVALLSIGAAAPIKPDLLAGLVWRNVGPFRGGRISAVSGAIGEPGVFYAGTPAGGVWKTTSAGETWYPVFDAVKSVASIGAVEVAPSNPNIVYVGAGDKVNGGGANVGNGLYKSEDAGATWRHLGLDDSRVIPSILVDPRNPDIVLVASEGDLWKKSENRGVYRSTDGGRTFAKTLYLNDSTGVQKIARAFDRLPGQHPAAEPDDGDRQRIVEDCDGENRDPIRIGRDDRRRAPRNPTGARSLMDETTRRELGNEVADRAPVEPGVARQIRSRCRPGQVDPAHDRAQILTTDCVEASARCLFVQRGRTLQRPRPMDLDDCGDQQQTRPLSCYSG